MGRRRSPVQTRSILSEGVVVPPTGMEVVVADHCNITCRQCNHGSPVMPKWNLRAEDLVQDLAVLARHYRPAFVKYIGGEPLLHPDLPAILRAGRASGIALHHMLVTNGVLLARMNPEIWGLIDEVEVSVYPGSGVTKDSLARHVETAARYRVRLTINHFPQFRRTFTRHRIADDGLVDQIFRACKVANVWGCHSLYKGALYRCPQSAYALGLAGAEGFDGFRLEAAEDLAPRLLAFLNGREPLLSCRYCVGTAGRKEDHAMLPRTGWKDDLDQPAEAMLDRALLAENLCDAVTLDDCKTPDHRRSAGPLRTWLARLGLRPKRMRRARIRLGAD